MASTIFQATVALASLLAAATAVNAESHTVHFVNNCGFGTPTLIQGANTLSTGQDFTSQGPLSSAIAYLQNNNQCGFNGEHCSLLEMTLVNPTVPGGGSSADISLIPPHAFNVAVAFEFPQCSGTQQVCSDSACTTAFFQPDDTTVQRACQVDNAGITITFCPAGSGAAPPKPPPSPPQSAVPVTTHVAAPIAPIAPAPSASNAAVPPVNPVAAPAKPAPVKPAPASSSQPPSSTPSPAHSTCKRSRARRRAASTDAIQQESRAVYDAPLRRRRAHGRRLTHGSFH